MKFCAEKGEEEGCGDGDGDGAVIATRLDAKGHVKLDPTTEGPSFHFVVFGCWAGGLVID